MPLSHEEILHLASLVRMGLDDEEAERLQGQLSQILDQFQILQELDTTNVPPTDHSAPLHNVMREDEVETSFTKEVILGNAPRREADLFQVRVVLEE